MELVFKLSEISNAAAKFWHKYSEKRVFALSGAMGAGKTTFVHALAELLGVRSAVSSPTFALINEYAADKTRIYHIDLYRLNSEEDAIRAGVEDCIFSDAVCFVEWPERIPNLFPEDAVHVRISVVDHETRALTVEDK